MQLLDQNVYRSWSYQEGQHGKSNLARVLARQAGTTKPRLLYGAIANTGFAVAGSNIGKWQSSLMKLLHFAQEPAVVALALGPTHTQLETSCCQPASFHIIKPF